MNGYIEFAPGPAGTGLDGAVRLFRKLWPVLAGHGGAVEVLVRHGRHRGWGSVGRLLRLEQPWTRLGLLAALTKDDQTRLHDLTDLTLEVFFLVSAELARRMVAALSGTERQRQEDLVELPLSDSEVLVLRDMLRLCADGQSVLVGTADEGNLVYLLGESSLLTTVE